MSSATAAAEEGVSNEEVISLPSPLQGMLPTAFRKMGSHLPPLGLPPLGSLRGLRSRPKAGSADAVADPTRQSLAHKTALATMSRMARLADAAQQAQQHGHSVLRSLAAKKSALHRQRAPPPPYEFAILLKKPKKGGQWDWSGVDLGSPTPTQRRSPSVLYRGEQWPPPAHLAVVSLFESLGLKVGARFVVVQRKGKPIELQTLLLCTATEAQLVEEANCARLRRWIQSTSSMEMPAQNVSEANLTPAERIMCLYDVILRVCVFCLRPLDALSVPPPVTRAVLSRQTLSPNVAGNPVPPVRARRSAPVPEIPRAVVENRRRAAEQQTELESQTSMAATPDGTASSKATGVSRGVLGLDFVVSSFPLHDETANQRILSQQVKLGTACNLESLRLTNEQ